mmetsp:Transcript_26033/g.46174  ORF Transcript_26033/g.46174 Transcript_26033/m.46174 type:complete len:1579 (+) Transcript_26033:307-5043(+)
MKVGELEACLRAQAQTIESLLNQLANSDTAPLASALKAALQREETLKRQCSELLESMHQDITEDKRMSNLAQSLDSQNQNLLAENSRLKEELNVLSEQVGVLRRSVSPLKGSATKRAKTTPKKQALLEHVEEMLATKDFFTAGNKWRDVDYVFIEGEAAEKNFENLREILKLRDKQMTTMERDLRTKTKEPAIAVEKLIREIKEKDAEIDLLKNSILSNSDVRSAAPEVKALKDKVQVLQDGIDSREHDIRELLGEYETIRRELKDANEKLEEQEQELGVLRDLPQDYRLDDILRELDEAKTLLSHKEHEVSRLLSELVDVQNERDNIRFKLVQSQSSQEEASHRKHSFEKDAQILRLNTELKLLKSRIPYTDLKERLRRSLQKSTSSGAELEFELKEIVAAIDNELSQRISAELASLPSLNFSESGGHQSRGRYDDSKGLSLEKSQGIDSMKLLRNELENRQALSQAEVMRMRTLYDEEHKAHQKCLKLLKDNHPSIAEYEMMREDYFRGLQANLNRIIEQLTQRVETLVSDIKSKNDEILKQEARYEADIKSLSDKLKSERAKYKELGERLTQEIERHKETKSRLDSTEDKGVYHSSEEAQKLLMSLRDSEMNLTNLHDRVQELQLSLSEKSRRIEILEVEAASYKDQAERLRLSEQTLYNQLVNSGKQQSEGSTRTKQDLELARHEIQNLNAACTSHKNMIGQLEAQAEHLRSEIQELNGNLASKDAKLQALKQENSALKDEQRNEVNSLKLKLQAIQQQSFEESDEMKRGRDERAAIEKDLAHARKIADNATDEALRYKGELARLEADKKKIEASLEEASQDYEHKMKQQADTIKSMKLEVARLKRIEQQSDEISTDNEIYKQEIETLRQEKARLRRKLDSVEDTRREDSGMLTREDDVRNQYEQLKRTLHAKEQEIESLKDALDAMQSRQFDSHEDNENELLISQLNEQIAKLTQELHEERDERRGLSLRVSQLMSVAESENPDSYKAMWQREKERINDLNKELRRVKDSSDDYRGLLENVLEYIEQIRSDWKGVEEDLSSDFTARVLAAKEAVAELLATSKSQRLHPKQSDLNTDRRAEDSLRRLEQAAQKVEEQLRSTESVQHSTVLALIAEKIAAERELYEKSKALLDNERFLNFPDEGINKWALQKWQEAEREVCRLRGQLLDSAKKMEHLWRKYDPGNEVIELRKQLERSTTQLQSLQKAVNWLQSERQKVVPQETFKSGAEANVLRSHLKAIVEEAESLKAQLATRERENEVLKRTAQDSSRIPLDKLRNQAFATAVEFGLDFEAEPGDIASTLHSVSQLLNHLSSIAKEEKDTAKSLKAEIDHERQGQRMHTDALQVSVDSLRKEKASVEHHVKELAAQVRSMSRELELAREGLYRSNSHDDMVKSAFERGRLIGVGEGRQQERKELEIESKRMQDLVREYRQSREELRKTQERLLLKQRTEGENDRLSLVNAELQQKSILVEKLRQELDQCKHYFASREDEYRELLTHKDEEVLRLRSLISSVREEPNKTRKAAADDEFVLDLLGRRNSAVKEIQESERTRRPVDPAMKAYVKELNSAIARYGES